VRNLYHRNAWTLIATILLLVANTTHGQATPSGFSFLIGPYPSKGIIEYQLDCGDFHKANPAAVAWTLDVQCDGKSIINRTAPIAADGKAHDYLDVGKMPDGAVYTVTAILTDQSQKELARQTQTFTRHVMPFETADPIGASDIIVPPFTPPVIDATSVSCWSRTYQHGTDGLLSQITAAGKPLFSRPATLLARTGDGQLTILTAAPPQIKPVGKGQASYQQTFTGAGITLNITGDFDYDGFYLFTVNLAPTNGPVKLADLRLEIPYADTVAQLIEASVSWRRIQGTQPQCSGELEPKQGILWDSKTFPSRNWPRIGNMPPFVWIGDDDRGLVYSCASEQGMHNDENLPAAQLERRGHDVVYTAWFVNSPLQLDKPRTFQFALQASPFKAMPENSRLWRNLGYRQPYKNGVQFTNWFTNGSYPTYGRYLTLPVLKKYADATGADQVGTMASAVSECGGTPEYQQFWHEWGSGLGWDNRKLGTPPDWAQKMFTEANIPINPYVMVESASNVSPTNVAYRLWWYDQEARHADISFVYQDNPPNVTYYDPPNGYGYTRDDGRPEPTSAIWNSRQFMKRMATTAVEAGKTNSPYIWANAISPVLPGRSFCRKMLNGEYLYTKLFTLGQIRVMASKQWGMELDWYPFPQTEESPYPNIGPVRKYWRTVFSRLLLHDITNISGSDNAGFAERWINALDVFWLDDPSVIWHPYYRNDTQPITSKPTTYVSTYTATGRALLFISNQSDDAVVETINPGNLDKFGAANLKYFYDAETGEQIETTGDGALKMFIPGTDYRLVIGFPKPWTYAAAKTVGQENLPAQSTLDPEQTLTAISRQLLTSPTFKPAADAHQLYQQWMTNVMSTLSSDAPDVVYYNAQSCADIDFGNPGIQCSMFFDKRRDALLVNYCNSTDNDVNLNTAVRDKLAKKAGKQGHNYIIHPVTGISEWELIDIPAHQGLLEIYYSDSPDFWGPRVGPFKTGTMLANIRKAVDENQRKYGRNH
jgi:Family of unknown function (DUF6067)